MKKVLVVVTDRKTGGLSVVLEDVLNNLSLEKYKIDLLILNNDGDRIEGKISDKIKIIYGGKLFRTLDISLGYFKTHFNLGLLFNKLHLMFLLKTGLIKKRLQKERKILLTDDYDVEVAFKDGFCAIFTASGDTPNKVHWLHSNYGATDPTRHYRHTFQNGIYDKFNKIIAVSKETADGFNSHYHMDEKMVVIKNIMDNKKIKREGAVPEKLSSKKNNFISVGRLASAKGYDRLLRVVSTLKNEGLFEDSFVTIIGDGPDKDNLLKLKEDLHLDCVNFAGNQMNPYKFMAGADVYISAARYEPFGLVMGEALILHVPVLAVETAATSVIIDNDSNGLIVENSEKGLYNGMKKIIIESGYLEKLKKNALNYDYEPINIETINTIERILDN